MRYFGKSSLVQIVIPLSHETFPFLRIVVTRKRLGNPQFTENLLPFKTGHFQHMTDSLLGDHMFDPWVSRSGLY